MGSAEERARAQSWLQLNGRVSSLIGGVCWSDHVSQGLDVAFRQRDRMFLVHFHALVEVHFQGRALS